MKKYTQLTVMKYISKYIGDMKGSVILLIVLSLLAVFVPITNPKFFQILIDDVMIKGQHDKFVLIVAGLLGIYLARLILDWLNLILSNRILNRFIYSIRVDIWNKYLNMNKRTTSMSSSELKMRIIDDVDSLSNFIKDQVVEYISSYFLGALALVLALTVNIKFALICFMVIPAVFLINYGIGLLVRKINEKVRQVNEEYYGFEHGSLSQWKEIKANAIEDKQISKFVGFRKKLAKLGYTSIRYWFYTETINDFKANYLSKAMVYCIGVFFVVTGKITLGNLFMFAGYYELLFSAIDTIQTKKVMLKTMHPYLKRIFETLDIETDKEKIKIDKLEDITAKNVSLSLGGKRILKNISIDICLGDRIALCGKSGAGKSMLVKTLLGLNSVDEGEILYNNIPVNKTNLYGKVIAVMQDPFFFNMSIRDNLMLAKKDADIEALETACKRANILDFVNSLPLGFDTIIGEGGVKLSGGQKQRLAIAGAVLKHAKNSGPYLIILDEITSSLDAISEDVIRQTIKAFDKEDIVISISHRPSMLEDSIRHFNIDEGKLKEVNS